MATAFRVFLAGDLELSRRMERLDVRIQSRAQDKALREASKPIVQAARANIQHEETGLLRKSLGGVIRRYRKARMKVMVIGPRSGFAAQAKHEAATHTKRRPFKYAHLVEGGTKPHRQRFAPILGGVIRFGGDMHPGAKPKPFFEPAFKANVRRAETIFVAVLRREISRAGG